jgi:hypothetical protein
MAQKKAFALRIDAKLYRELRVWAESEFRSVNGQIEFLLSRALSEHRRAASSEKNSRKLSEKTPPRNAGDRGEP